MGEQVALLTKRASGKIWVMRRLKNLGLDGKKTISGFFFKAEGRLDLEVVQLFEGAH